MNELTYNVMQHHWGSEWIALTELQQQLIMDDWMEADCTAGEYKARIWEGNLASYVKCLEIN